MNRMALLMLLDELEELIDSAPEIPLTGRSLIDGDKALELLARIRESLPEDLRQGEGTAGSSGDDGSLSGSREAPSESERIVMEAEAYASRLVEEHEVTRRAKEEAERLLEEARRRARELERDAERYAREVLERLESSLERTLQVVQRGKEELNGSVESSPDS